jgi:hypothetical protein
MLATVQFPLADMRQFVTGSDRRLPKPSWPDAHPGGEFVRGIGGVDFRHLGGLSGWIGEGTYCEASRLILLDKLPKLSLVDNDDFSIPGNPVSTRLKFRRLFADGRALAKFEIGFAGSLNIFRSRRVPKCDFGMPFDFPKIISEILMLPCRVPGAAGSPLLFLGKSLAARYSDCTTKRSTNGTEPQLTGSAAEGLVATGDPLVFIDSSGNRVSLPSGYRAVTMPGNFDFQIFYAHFAGGSFRVPVWILVRNDESTSARHLRIYLQRIHAEKEVLRIVLNNIASGRLEPDGDDTASDSLQRYLLDSTNRIGRLERKADKNASEGIGALAGSCLEFVRPGWLDTLMQRLYLLNVRPMIRRNVEALVRRGNALLNLGVINIDQSHHDSRRGSFMGDTFSNIQNSTIVNRSTVESAFNKTKSEMGADTAAILLKIADLVAQSGNKEAGELLDQFNEELTKPQPRKSLLKRSWDGLVAILPGVTSIAGAVAAMAELFS